MEKTKEEERRQFCFCSVVCSLPLSAVGPVGLVLFVRLPLLCHKEHAKRAARQTIGPSPWPRTQAGGQRSPDGDVRFVGPFDKTDLADADEAEGGRERRCDDGNAARERFRLRTRDRSHIGGNCRQFVAPSVF